MSYLPQIAVVTGASAGFGAAFVRRFARAGVRVVATGRRLDRLQGLAAEHPDLILALELDLQDTDAVRRALTSLPPAMPP